MTKATTKTPNTKGGQVGPSSPSYMSCVSRTRKRCAARAASVVRRRRKPAEPPTRHRLVSVRFEAAMNSGRISTPQPGSRPSVTAPSTTSGSGP